MMDKTTQDKKTVEDRLIEQQEKIERRFQGIGKGKYSRILKMAKNQQVRNTLKYPL